MQEQQNSSFNLVAWSIALNQLKILVSESQKNSKVEETHEDH